MKRMIVKQPGRQDQWDLDHATRLLQFANKRTRGQTGRKAVFKSWIVDFRLLRQQYGEDTVHDVLEWYIHHQDDPYLPVVNTARKFRQKFQRLQEAMNRGVANATPASPEATRLQMDLGLQWPEDQKDEELTTIQISLDNFRRYRQRLKELRHTPHHGLVEFLLSKTLSPIHFVEWWMRDLHRLAWNWDGWNGHLAAMAFRIDSPHFTKLARQWTREYCGVPSRWDALAEKLNAR